MFLKSLNVSQAEAATFGDGPLLILAGAGSGKTRVLTARIAYLVLKKGTPPQNILAVTFTNKAAGEMRERLTDLIGEKAKSLWLGTFHSLGLRILRQENGVGLPLTVYNDDDQLSLIKQTMAELLISEKTFSPRAILSRINQAKNENIGPREYLKDEHDFLSERVSKVYSLYQKKLREMGCMDFGDLICEPINLLQRNPSLLKKYQERFKHILVDEYQDTNKAQYLFTKLLASGTRNLFAVGDPDQSIYLWRGADIGNILDFEKDYPDATLLRLEQNYRSTKTILNAANAVIERNEKRHKKALWTENPEGSKVTYEEALTEHNEAGLIINRLKSILDGNRSLRYRDFAVFYRTNAQSRVFEEALIREGIPYTIVGGVKFYDRKEIRDAIAYLRVIANPNDSLSLQRIVNTPARGVGKTTLEKVQSLSDSTGLSLFEAFRLGLERGILQKTRIAGFIEACDDFRKDVGLSLHELSLRLLEDSGYMLMYQEEGTEEALERTENIFEFISAIKDFEEANAGASLSDFLDQVALISDVDSYEDKAERLALMTIHAAKGLEFKVVFIAGMEENLFPHSRSVNDPEQLEEERRLCYVGMTRAREELYLYSARSRTVFGETRYQSRSRFIDEIPPEFLSVIEKEEEPRRAGRTNEPYYTSEGSQLERLTDDTFEEQPWKIGMLVEHPSFGVGVIKERSGTGEETKLTINFQSSGTKKLIVKYASLLPLS